MCTGHEAFFIQFISRDPFYWKKKKKKSKIICNRFPKSSLVSWAMQTGHLPSPTRAKWPMGLATVGMRKTGNKKKKKERKRKKKRTWIKNKSHSPNQQQKKKTKKKQQQQQQPRQQKKSLPAKASVAVALESTPVLKISASVVKCAAAERNE